jgi:hypothetical protein
MACIYQPNSHLKPMRFILSLLGLGTSLLAVETNPVISDKFYREPNAAFAIHPKEVLKKVDLNTVSVEAAQSQIENCRLENPEAIWVFVLKGKLMVKDAPLVLGTKNFLELAEGSSIVADEKATAESLIKISQSENLNLYSKSKKGGILKGNGKVTAGIIISKSSRVNIDQLHFENLSVGIKIESEENALIHEASSVTRCEFLKIENAIIANKINGFVALDNSFKDIKGTGIAVNSPNATLAGNSFNNVVKAFQFGAENAAFVRNAFINCLTAFETTAESKLAFISQNKNQGNEILIKLEGEKHTLFDNTIAGKISTTATSPANHLIYKNPNLKTSNEPTLIVFNPPTSKNPHKDNAILPGMGRYDVEIKGDKGADTKKWPDLSSAQKQADEARAQHPQDFIVIHLKGNFAARTPQGLSMPTNSCVILDGTIIADTDSPVSPPYVKGEKPTQLIEFPKEGYGAVSGGKLDANHKTFYCIRSSSGKSDHGMIEDVTMYNGARDGLYTKARNSKSRLIVSKCNFSNNHGRALWAHVSGPVFAVENYLETSGKDGIDLDAGAKYNICVFNTAVKNKRHGVFIEEASHNNIVFGNELNGNLNSAVHVWNEEVNGNTTNNSTVANVCNGNRRGLSCGGRDATKLSSSNLYFNNECSRNTDYGIITGNKNGLNNYFSQSIVKDNKAGDILVNETAKPYLLNTPNQ